MTEQTKHQKQTFILGAGFSKAVADTMPLLNELSQEIKQKIDNTQDEDIKHFWNDFIIKNNIGNIQDKDTANFEDILTYLSTNFTYENYKGIGLKNILYEYIKEQIVEIFKEKNIEKEIKDDQYLKNFLNYLVDTKTNVCTFNYDLVLENSFKKIKPDAKDNHFKDLYIIQKIDTGLMSFFSEKNDDILKNTINIYKLHGSINWLYDKDVQNGIRVISDGTLPEYKLGLSPLIVPPTISKNFSQLTPLLNIQWYKFREELENAEKIYIIGYSIPKTDIATYYALKTLIKHDAKIVIVNKIDENDEKVKEWKVLFSKQNLEFCFEGFTETFVNKYLKHSS
ncbi:MAG: hypothetical protein AB7E39_06790 [Endomicrobiaceae bacterium]